jgi:hypothetical protein
MADVAAQPYEAMLQAAAIEGALEFPVQRKRNIKGAFVFNSSVNLAQRLGRRLDDYRPPY